MLAYLFNCNFVMNLFFFPGKSTLTLPKDSPELLPCKQEDWKFLN